MNPLKRASRAWTACTLAAVALAMVVSACGSGGAGDLTRPTASSSPGASVAPSVAVSTATASPAEAPSLAAGWTRTPVPADGYSIDTPAGWKAVSISGEDIDALIAEMQSSDPELAAILQKARGSGQKFSFVAVTTDETLIGDTGFTPNVNVVVASSQGYDAGFIAGVLVTQLKKLTGLQGDVEDTAVALPADPGAHRLRYRINVNNKPAPTVVTSYLISHGGRIYNITVSALDSQLARIEDSFLTIARSVTFLAP